MASFSTPSWAGSRDGIRSSRQCICRSIRSLLGSAAFGLLAVRILNYEKCLLVFLSLNK